MRIFIQIAILTVTFALVAASAPSRVDDSATLFGNGEVPRFNIQIDASALAALRLNPRTYVKATVSAGAEIYQDVGVHLKGNYGTFQNPDGKPSLTLNFNKYVRGQKFHGLDKLHLNNSAQDPSYLSELLSRELVLAAGLPTARVTHARVQLNGRDAGMYVLIEGYDKDFLQRHFRKVNGNLYDSEFMHDITQPLRKSSGVGPDDHSDLQTLAAAAEEPDASIRLAKLGALLDLDRFYTFLALELLAGHFDGYARSVNNYWLYHDPLTERMVFIPHGMDQMFVQPEGSLFPSIKGVVAKAVLGTPHGRDAVRSRCTMLFTNHFLKLTNRVDELRQRLQPVILQLGSNAVQKYVDAVADLQRRVALRNQHLHKEFSAPPPPQIRLQAVEQVALTNWLTNVEQGKVEFQAKPADTGSMVLQARLEPGEGSALATWHTRVALPRGRYQIRASLATDQPVIRGPNRPGSLKLWGGVARQTESVANDRQHLELLQEFEVQFENPEEILIQCVVQAKDGTLTWKLGPVLLTRIE
jgi:hypothetical protein